MNGGMLSKDWDYYSCRLGSDLASIYLDLGIAAEAPISTHPHSVSLSVAMVRAQEDGMSSQEEFDDLIALEDGLTARLHGENAIYVGRLTSRGYRVFHYYCAEPEFFALSAKAEMEQHPTYRYEIGARADADWSAYFGFLYPSPADYQRIQNRRLN